MRKPLGVGVPTVDEAVAASLACAAALDLDVDTAEVIASGYGIRVLLRPAYVVSRVMTAGQVLRGDPLPWLSREVDVATFLAASGAAVVPPFESPGPHHSAGVDLTLWPYVEAQPGTASQRQFATLLFDLHAHLVRYPGELPLLAGPFTDIESALGRSNDATLHRAAARLLPEARRWPRHAVHGDAHGGNVLSTSAGFRWIDLEDACLGPLEWDFASLTITEDAIAAYPGHLDRALIERCRQLRRLQVLASILIGDVDSQTERLRHELNKALAAEATSR